MRQAGVLAAAGLVALRDHVDRLADDHARAAAARRRGRASTRLVPDELRRVPRTDDPARCSSTCAADGVLAGTIGPGMVRLMTHLDVDDAGVERALAGVAAAGAPCS